MKLVTTEGALARSYEIWASIDPESCKCQSHEYGAEGDAPMPDERVCARERAWRRVVRIRDRDINWKNS